MKHQPQSIHWTQDVVDVRSGIWKSKEGKIYYLYISDSKHNTKFPPVTLSVKYCQRKIWPVVIPSLSTVTIVPASTNLVYIFTVWIPSEYGIKLLRTYGIPGNGENEVDYIGGAAKVRIWQMMSSGSIFHSPCW